MAFPSLGQLCRRKAIANINQVTYIPEGLSITSVMDILTHITSAGILTVIQTNSPHLLTEGAHGILWQRFAEKEFAPLLKAKRAAHKAKYADADPEPPLFNGTWEDMYRSLAIEHCAKLNADLANMEASVRALAKAKDAKKAILVSDPRTIAQVKPRGMPGSSAMRSRGPQSALQKINAKVRLETSQRKQAVAAAAASAAKPRIKTAVASKDSPDSARKSIRKPEVSLKHTKAKEQLRLQRETSAANKLRSSSPTSDQTASTASPTSANGTKSASTTSAVSNSATASADQSPASSAPSVSPQKLASLSASSVQKPTAQPTKRPGLMMNPMAIKNMKPETTIIRTTRSDGTVTDKSSINWSTKMNQRIFSTYSPEKQAAILAENPTAATTITTTTTCGSNKKRGADDISANDSPSSSGASPAPGKPAKKKVRTGSGGVFMPPRRR